MNSPKSWLLMHGIAGAVCWTLACGSAAAQGTTAALADETVVVYADGRQQPATLTAWDGQTVTLQTPGDDAPRRLPIDQLLRYGPAVPREVSPVQTPRSVWLVDGSRLSAKRLTVEGGECRIANRWCRLTIPVERIQAIQWSGPLDAASWLRLEQQLAEIEGADDAVLMVDGELRRGRLDLDAWQAAAFHAAVLAGNVSEGRAGQGRGLPLEQEGRAEQIALTQIRAVVPSPALRQSITAATGDVWVETVDGSRLRVRQVDAQGQWVLACGQKLETRAGEGKFAWLRSLAAVDPVDGLLAADEPLRYRAVPVFGPPRPLRRWSAGGVQAIEVAATSRLVYRVVGSQRLRGKVVVPAVNDRPVPATCQFTVQTARGGKVTTHWRSEPLSAGVKSVQEFDVALDEGGLLILGSDSVSGGDRSRPIWLDTVLAESP